jgi:hypothetical protein
VSAYKAFENTVRKSDRQYARIEHGAALRQAMNDLVSHHVELFKLFQDDPSDPTFMATSGGADFSESHQLGIESQYPDKAKATWPRRAIGGDARRQGLRRPLR